MERRASLSVHMACTRTVLLVYTAALLACCQQLAFCMQGEVAPPVMTVLVTHCTTDISRCECLVISPACAPCLQAMPEAGETFDKVYHYVEGDNKSKYFDLRHRFYSVKRNLARSARQLSYMASSSSLMRTTSLGQRSISGSLDASVSRRELFNKSPSNGSRPSVSKFVGMETAQSLDSARQPSFRSQTSSSRRQAPGLNMGLNHRSASVPEEAPGLDLDEVVADLVSRLPPDEASVHRGQQQAQAGTAQQQQAQAGVSHQQLTQAGTPGRQQQQCWGQCCGAGSQQQGSPRSVSGEVQLPPRQS